jgi:hypothetical protein
MLCLAALLARRSCAPPCLLQPLAHHHDRVGFAACAVWTVMYTYISGYAMEMCDNSRHYTIAPLSTIITLPPATDSAAKMSHK